jgi:hypothetical protein
MDSVRKLESKVASWYKDVPHLPENAAKWIAQNIWWMALIGVVLGAMTIFSIISVTFFAGAVFIGYGGAIGAAVAGVALVAVIFSLAFWALELVLMGLAITPLRTLQKKGWTLLFMVALLQVVAHGVSFLFNLNLFSLIWSLLYVAVGAYFLFEIRGQFGAHNAKTVKAKK